MIKTKVIYLCGAWALLASCLAQAAPFFQAAGTAASGTGAITVAWPTHAINDVALLFVESSGGQPVTLSTPSGFVQVAGSPQATGSGTAGTQFTVFWARATSTAMSSVTVADPGDHVYARILTYRGVISTGNPWDVTVGGIKSTASSSVTVTGVTTIVADTLIVQAVAHDRDSNNAHFSAQTNVNLASIAERSDAGTGSGNGGGFAVWDGVFAGPGATGNTTAAITDSVVNAFISIALKPVAGTGSVTSSPSTCSTQTGVGTVAWASPLEAVSSNNIYATASNVRGNVTTNYLNCTGFNFSAVPAGAVITGITVSAERRTSGGTIRDRFVYLIKGGVISTAFNAATITNYPTTDTIEAHGGSANLWGTTWTEAEVKAANFGAAFASYNVSTTSTNNRTVRVDHIQVRVDYTQPALHHIRIEHDGSASTCAPESIIIKACFNAACTVPHYSSTDVTGVNLAPTVGYTWTPASTVSIAAASGGVNSGITIAGSSSGTASLAISGTPSPAPASAFQCYNRATLASGGIGSAACNLVFSSDTFSYSVPDHSAATRQVVTMTSCTAGFANTNRNVRFWSSYSNPATGTLQGRVAAGTGNADCVTAYSALGTSLASAASLSLAFGSGVAPQASFSLCYPDAGVMRLDARYDGATTNTPNDNGVVILGNDTYIAAPASFSFSGIACNTVGATTCAPANVTGINPVAIDANGGAFIQAGRPFRATVTALNALGVATPNFGRETLPEIIALQAISNASLCPATSSCLIAPGGGASGNLVGAFASAGAGTGAVSTIDASWDEVGIIRLRAANTSYLGSTLNVYGLSGNVGRFIPDHFDVIPDVTAPVANRTALCDVNGLLVADGVTACTWPTYTYMGERMDTQFSLVAQALSNTTTQNYTGLFAKLNPVATNATLLFAAIDTAVPTYLTARLDTSLITTSGSGSFNAGVADVIAPISISRGAAADGPYAALNIGIAPLDSDSVSTVFDLDTDATAGADHTLIGVTAVRYGRTRISNAYGSELLALSMPIVAQYWNAIAYVTSADDNLSVFALALGNYQNYLNMGETTLTLPNIVNGRGFIGLSAAGAGNNGSVDITVTSPAYLPGNAGRATFGVYRGNNNFIYQREAY